MFSTDTMIKVADAANGKMSVFIYPELEHYDDDFGLVLQEHFYPMAEHFRDKNARIYVRTKHAFWQSIIYMPLWSRLLSGEFARVFVPSMEETTDKTMEQSVVGRVGIWASGAVDQWGSRGARDNASFDRLRQHSHQMIPNHFLRAQIYNIAYGATFQNNFPVNQEYFSILYELIAKGALYVPNRDEIVSFSPVHLSMTEPDDHFRNSRPWGVWTPEADSLIEPNFTTVARIAKAGGYSTAFFGKWGLGGVWNGTPADYSKMDAGAVYYGFDYAVELPQGIQNKPYAFYEDQQWMKLKPDSTLTHIPFEQTGYAVKEPGRDRSGMGDSNWNPALAGPLLAGKAVAYIENQTKARPDNAFFLYYCSQAVHVPHSPPDAIDGVKIAGSTKGAFGDMIRELDVQVGMIVKALKSADVYDNTLLVFTSDNGGLNADVRMKQAGHNSSNGLRGKKGSIYEGGHRVPFIAVWPGTIQPGSESREPIVGHDMVATVGALAEQPVDRYIVKDSISLLPFFKGQPASERHRCLIHQQKGKKMPYYAIREGDWKLILTGKTMGELEMLIPHSLFNLKENLGEDEAQNLVKHPEHKDRVNSMADKYMDLRVVEPLTVSASRE
jgi:arylsulfatase A-like enzyme